MAEPSLTAQSQRLAKRLNGIPESILKRLRPALVQSAQDLAHTAEQLAPEDTGALRDSIAVTPPGGTTPAYAEGGGRRIAAANQSLVTVGSPTQRHGHLVEFGTKPHENGGMFAGTQHPGTAPNPFLEAAIRLTAPKNKRRIGRAIGQAVRKYNSEGGTDA